MKKSKVAIVVILVVVIFNVLTISNIGATISQTQTDEIEKKLNDSIVQLLNTLDLTELEKYFADIEGYGFVAADSFLEKVKAIINGDFKSVSGNFFNDFINLMLGQVVVLLPTLISVIVIAILCGVISQIKSKSMSGSVGDIVSFACYCVIIIFVLVGVWSLVNTTKSTIQSIKIVMNVVMPILITLMTAIGGIVSAKVYQPAIALLSTSVVEMITNIVLPLFIFSLIFAIISNISTNVKINKLAEFFKSATSWVIGLTFTIFTSFLAVQGLTAATIDGISIRAAKFATKNYIPILGGYLSDGFDLILASATLIKNAFGVVSLLLLVGIILMPIIQILCYMWGLKLVAAIIEPVADSKITKFVSSVSSNINILFVSILAIAFMFLITIMLIIFTSNAFV